MTIHASKLSTSKKYNKEVFCIMFAAKSVPAYRIRQQFRSGAKINAKYNPQNEMFRLLGTKRSFSQNETFFFSHP